jgi:ribosomal protein S18 acetylase RimI-like enzyme
MPKIRREKLPDRLLAHLLARMRERSISYEQLTLLARWLDSEPEVPAARWFKRFPGFTVCGEGELVRIFLIAGQAPDGHEIV